MLEKTGLCFMFAPVYHPAMKYVMPVRRALAMRTIFNILGPLTNPARANIQLLGVYDKGLIRPMAQTLQNLGVRRGHGGVRQRRAGRDHADHHHTGVRGGRGTR